MSSLKLWFSYMARLLYDRKLRKETMNTLERMHKEGVNLLSTKARRAWIREHREEISLTRPLRESLELESTKRNPRRNGPCPCKSGKKYKKCCGLPEK